MQTHTTPRRPIPAVAQKPDERLVLLEEVDFKWLMAGRGWWIDTDRLHNDPSYATHLLDLVEMTESDALKECAAALRTQLSTGIENHPTRTPSKTVVHTIDLAGTTAT